jgi:hypothetical protein
MKGYVAILTLRGILTFNCDSIAASPPVRAYFERTRISKISFGTPVYFYPSILHQTYVKMSDELPINPHKNQSNRG